MTTASAARAAPAHGTGPDFIGLGVQRSGTSWIYACLYEHPEIYIPFKEIHFFSRDRNWCRGYGWYEAQFAARPKGCRAGEFSTSYFADPATPDRIAGRYPSARLVVSLRDPVRRAYSNYLNDAMAGVITAGTSFRAALAEHPEYIERGRYFSQLCNFLRVFPREQIFPAIYEDSLVDPLGFIQRIYAFIGVDPAYVPSMLGTRVNEGRLPYFASVDRALAHTSAIAVQAGLRGVWWLAKKSGVGMWLRRFNTRERTPAEDLAPELVAAIRRTIEPEISGIAKFLGRDLQEWGT